MYRKYPPLRIICSFALNDYYRGLHFNVIIILISTYAKYYVYKKTFCGLGDDWLPKHSQYTHAY